MPTGGDFQPRERRARFGEIAGRQHPVFLGGVDRSVLFSKVRLFVIGLLLVARLRVDDHLFNNG